MTEELRSLLYPFGFLAQFAFGMRFFVQWLAAEKEGRCYTPKLFWQLSLTANLILFVHSLIQLNFPISLVQSQNSILSWRNLNLLGPKKRQKSFLTVVGMLFCTALFTICFFAKSSNLSFEIPKPFELIGLIGISLYAFRFWVQWWQAETEKSCELSEPFWWISLVGAVVSATYF